MAEDRAYQTKFASSQRSSLEELQSAQDIIVNEEFFIASLNAFPEVVLVLNENRQIVYANQKLLQFLGVAGMENVLGQRPGEAINCVHSHREEGGCGTSFFCRECGAVRAILNAQKGKQDFQECRMTVQSPKGEVSLDLRVWAVPVVIQGRTFTFFTIKDIADEKRREALEHTFFHDILNEVGILVGYSENVKDGLVPSEEKPAEKIHKYSQRIIEFIQEQRDLVNAERGLYTVQPETFPVGLFLQELVVFYKQHKLGQTRGVVLEDVAEGAFVTTDRVLLRRVIGNLIKNALEATAPGQRVTVRYAEQDGKKVFIVHNPEVMPQNIQSQIFQRSFSTKGPGRGLGTYSVKLFVEQYLKGKVSFESAEGAGTTFFVRLR